MTSIKSKKNNFKEVISNKLLAEIIEKIILSYPITLIDLERFRKEIDAFDELFWMMNEEGKYLLVNNKFATSLNLTPSQIEGKSSENFIPAYLLKFNLALDDYIKESRSVFVIEGFPLSGIPFAENFQTIEVPVTGSENLVNAIIGIAQKADKKNEESSSSGSSNKDKQYSESLNDDKVHDVILENIPDPVFIYDKENLRFLHINNAAQKLYGYRKDEFLNLDLTDLYAPEDIQTLLEASEEKFKEGIYSKPHRQKKKDGKIIYVEVNRKAINYKNNQAFFNIIRDVSKTINFEKESQLFNSFFENSNNLIFITDKEGFIQSVNNAVIETLGYSAKSLQQTSFSSLLIDDDRGRINSSVFQGTSKEKQILNTSFKKAGNEVLNAKITASPVFNFKGDIEGYNVICFVMEERIREVVKEVIKEIPAEINYSEELKSAPDAVFLSGVFHDLLTPINVISSFAQELVDDIAQPSSEQNEIIQILNQNRMNLLDTMNQAVEYIRIEKQKADIEYNSVKIIDIVDSLEKDIALNKILGDGELAYGKISSSLEIKTDRQKLLKFLSLLVQVINKCTGFSKLYISVLSSNGNKFIISIKDGYNAASDNFLEKLTPVFKCEGEILPKVTGVSSLSFVLCKSLLKILGGESITIEEKGKKELAFIFPIDLEAEKIKDDLKNEQVIQEEIIVAEEKINESPKVETVQEEEILEDILVKDSEAVSQSEVDLSQLRCLYVEDQLDSQILFSMQMKELKEINFAMSFEQALPILRSKEIDFLVVDINLQGDYNGIDILKIVRTIPEYENIPVIAVSAYLLPGDREMFIKSGFSDFISKPVFKEKLLTSLEKVLFAHT